MARTRALAGVHFFLVGALAIASAIGAGACGGGVQSSNSSIGGGGSSGDDCGPMPGNIDCAGCAGFESPVCRNGKWGCEEPVCGPCDLPPPDDLTCVDPCTGQAGTLVCTDHWGCEGIPECSDEAEWSWGFPGAHPVAVATEVSGGFFATGALKNTDSLGGPDLTSAGGDDIFVARFDAGALPVYSVRFGGADDERGSSIAVDSAGNAFVCGVFDGALTLGADTYQSVADPDVFLMKLDPSGALVWSKRLAARGCQLAVTSLDDLVIAGFYGDSVDTGSPDFGDGPLPGFGGSDVFVAKLTNDGALVWKKAFGSASYEYNEALAVRPDGRILLGGMFRDPLDFGDGALVAAGDFDGYVVALYPDGEHLWSLVVGGADRDRVTSLAVLPDDRTAVFASIVGQVSAGGVAFTADDRDGLALVLDASGAPLHGTILNGVSTKIDGWDAWSIAGSGAGNLVLAGKYTDKLVVGDKTRVSEGDYDMALVTLDPGGAPIRVQSYGAENADVLHALALDPDGDAIVAGEYWSTLDLGNGPLPPGADHGLLAKLPAH